MQTIHEEHTPNPGQYITGNLWNLNLRPDILDQVGPLGSLTRHTASMASPNIPRYVHTGQWPARRISDLLTAPNIDNAMWPTSATWRCSASRLAPHINGPECLQNRSMMSVKGLTISWQQSRMAWQHSGRSMLGQDHSLLFQAGHAQVEAVCSTTLEHAAGFGQAKRGRMHMF